VSGESLTVVESETYYGTGRGRLRKDPIAPPLECWQLMRLFQNFRDETFIFEAFPLGDLELDQFLNCVVAATRG